ncbi:hypothetical protein DFR72_103249 [Lentzea flaviverrucosa]|uniref:Uncharacterized protein n=1 Tax=Lentzea flaviverrucosa TaxID=200379 RepID=A0A1H9BAP4_9PSEU|nr:hypothetical protein DFR72_103249 [Lentzea flaviverrucosa]SEP85328.1 hypothetical protein SAMN05216195_101409 [Lentzea flaviverrucosa]
MSDAAGLFECFALAEGQRTGGREQQTHSDLEHSPSEVGKTLILVEVVHLNRRMRGRCDTL